EVSEHVVNHFTKGEESYFPTGIEAIDMSLVGGFHVGRTYCFAALPKMGKTTLLSSMYSNQRMMGIPSAYIALEMSDMQIEERILCY
ncbi:DnaB-like helicase C-terminal domain-containing protein, partial [Listeria monocytogenes]|uniref:DnaB-like helicase C-terminal domain-containing protein n=1 Tax=Listeria monocytogenes TaxID=1639 RepID=UPI002FDC0803